MRTTRSIRKAEGGSQKAGSPARAAGLRFERADTMGGRRSRLADAEEVLRAIRGGEVDSVLVAGKAGGQVFTLEGAEHAYRLLIESMNEGALTLTADKTILYANQCFARMVRLPLEQVTGSSFRRFLSAADQRLLRPLMKVAARSGDKIQVALLTGNGARLPVQISVQELAGEGAKRVVIGMVVTDMTAARRSEEKLRTLTHRVVQAQEAERARVALELHDHITQLLCAVLVRSQTLAETISARDGGPKREAKELRELLGQTAEEVERISRELRPSVLDELGLAAVLGDTSRSFTERTGVAVTLACASLAERLPRLTELALYRIFQEALKNVEQHSRAKLVEVQLTEQAGRVQLTIKDDGVGFDPAHPLGERKGQNGLGLLGMCERAIYVGGSLTVKAARGRGTIIQARVASGKKGEDA